MTPLRAGIAVALALLASAVLLQTIAVAKRPNPAVDQRVKSLIAVISDPESPGARFEESHRAIAELVKIGEPAVPLLVETILASSGPTTDRVRGRRNGASYSLVALKRIGKPALPHVQKVWPKLDEANRWKLMPFRGQHDYTAALPFALASLESKSESVLSQAVRYLGQHKEAKARDPLLQILNTAPARVRWEVVDALTAIGGEKVIDAFIKLLAKDSWAAKGDGLIPPPGVTPPWWPDGRPHIVMALRKLKATKAASALVQLLEEKGPGKGYLADFIIPTLSEVGDRECIPALRRVAAANLAALSPHPKEAVYVKKSANDAIARIEHQGN